MDRDKRVIEEMQYLFNWGFRGENGFSGERMDISKKKSVGY